VTVQRLAMRGIVKRFDGRTVLDHAQFDVAPGEVHALLGENGAGKSTLMNVLCGLYRADAGEVRIDGAQVAIRAPIDAHAAGLGMVHQHFRLVHRFGAADNLRLAVRGRRDLRSRAQAARQLHATAESLGFALDTDTPVGELSLAERQRVEICKVLALGARTVVLDEPTAVLTDAESERLLAAVARMADGGRSVVLITHRLREVLRHAQRVTVMRQGRTVALAMPVVGLDPAALARLVMGEEAVTAGATARPVERPVATATPILAIESLATPPDARGLTLADISLAIRAGEIVGIAGVGGNGQSQLVDALTGLVPSTRGRVVLDGVDVTRASVAARRDRGLRVVPADRSASGLVTDLDIASNLALTRVRRGVFGRWWLRRAAMRADADRAIASHAIDGATPTRRTGLLSGGNAQKLLLARELAPGLRVLVAHSPTRGLDVRACAFVHAAIRTAVADGAACLLLSEDLEEVLALSDRIVVMSRGRLVGEVPAGTSPERIGALMLGHA
jgi:simple sugar transport system ATP-binding protein